MQVLIDRPFRGTIGWFALLMFLATAAPAAAYTITPVGTSGGIPGGQTLYEVSDLIQGDMFELVWTLDGSGLYAGAYPDLDGSAVVTITSLTATTVVIDITLSNDTAPQIFNSLALQAVMTVFGMVVDGVDLGNAGNGLSSPGASFDTYDEGNLPGIASNVCASTNSLCTRGSPQDGIKIGESDAFQFTLQGTFDTSNLTLRNFGTKWQTNAGSFELPGGIPMIPEPSTALLMGLGLAGIATVGRRRIR
jgi:hypothetical protein